MIENGGVLYRDDYVVDESSAEIVLLKIGAGLKKLYLEPTARCNLACVTCMRQQWPSLHDGEMDMVLFERLLEQMRCTWVGLANRWLTRGRWR